MSSDSRRTGRPYRRVSVVLAATLAVVLASCDSATNPPNGPSSPSAIVQITINAPDSLAPGQSVQLRATAVHADRSTEIVTAQWSSSNPAVIEVDAAGRALAIARGEVTVTATFEGRSGTALILSLASGTFKLSGRVVEEGRPVEGVLLTVIEGVGQGLTAGSDASGAFALYGVAGRVRIRARKEQYRETEREVTVNSNTTAGLEIAVSRQFRNLAGIYALTLTAAPCSPDRWTRGVFPDAAKTRSYIANVVQDGQELTVTLEGAHFLLNGRGGNSFFGLIDGDSVSFAIGRDANSFYPYWFYYHNEFSVIERLNDTSSLVIIGNVTARVTTTEIAGPLSGILIIGAGTELPLRGLTSLCSSLSHGFVMRRQ